MFNALGDPMNAQATGNDIQAAILPLTNMDNRALRDLVENDACADQYIQNMDLSTKKIMVSQNEMIMAENKSLAEYNLSFEPLLVAGRNNLKQVMQQIEEAHNSIKRKQEQMQTQSGSLSTETALALLQTAAAESEEESDKLVELFYQKDSDVDEFLDKFQESRKRMHLRRVKAEKMVDLLAQKKDRPTSGPRRAAPLPPYPIGPNAFFNNI